MAVAQIYLGKTRVLPDTAGPGAAALRTLLACLDKDAAFRVQPDAPFIRKLKGAPAIECCTSGSSGQPKIIRRSLQSWRLSFAVNRDLFGLSVADRAAVFGALSHSLTVYGIAEASHCGMGPHVLHGLRPRTQLDQIRQHQISVLYATPTQLRMLSGAPAPGVRLVLCGGGALDAATDAQVRQMFPRADLRAFYGASETSFITLTDAQTPAGSVGRAYPGVTLQIRARQGDAGEVWVKSPYLFDRYVQGDSRATRRDGEYMTVGEIGRLDAQGCLFLLGRQDRMVTIADQNVHPEALEQLLASLLPDRLCVVTTVPDDQRGHVLAAYIETGDAAPEEGWLRRQILSGLGAAMVPRKIIWVDRLPVLPSGKPDLSRLSRVCPWP